MRVRIKGRQYLLSWDEFEKALIRNNPEDIEFVPLMAGAR